MPAALRPSRPWWLAAGLVLAWAWFGTPTALAQPASCLKFGDVTVRSGERMDCDLNVIGGALIVEAGGEVVGSANAPLGDARVEGVVGGDAYAGGKLGISGTVGGDAFAGGYLVVEPDGEIKGDASALGDVTVLGAVDGDVESLGGNTIVSGAVNGSARAQGDITLAETALVQGGTSAGGALDRAAGAQVFGQVEPAAEVQAVAMRRAGFGLRLFLVLAMVFFVALFAALAVAVAPGAVGHVRDAAGGSALRSILVGGLLLLVFPLVMWLVIPIFLYGIGICLGVIGLGELLGRRLLGERSRPARTAVGTGILTLLLSLVLLVGYGSIAQLCLGLFGASIFGTILAAWGLGASTLTLLGTRPWPATAAAPTSAPGEGDGPVPSASPEAPVTPEQAAAIAAVGAIVAAEDEPSASEAWPGEAESDLPAVGFDEAAPVAGAAVVAAVADEAASEDERGPAEEASEAAGETPDEAAATEAGASAAETTGAGAADLRRVPGITPIYAQLLVAAGLQTVDDLANESPERVMAIASVPGVLPISADTASQWIRNARGMLGMG